MTPAKSEDNDDREQVEDNFYVRERMAADAAAGRASHGPGMFYRFRYGSNIEFVCLDTSKENLFVERLFEHPNHQEFVETSFPPANTPAWRMRSSTELSSHTSFPVFLLSAMIEGACGDGMCT